ncbi:MAG: hypothetical protein HN334_05565 [Candidatus Cloacimonetes bacterium]|jgi:hypothetical protein|nr:hypothetical protein [Candidatus Cloacimonadota bacterium]
MMEFLVDLFCFIGGWSVIILLCSPLFLLIYLGWKVGQYNKKHNIKNIL